MAASDGTTPDQAGTRARGEPEGEAQTAPEETEEHAQNVDLALGNTFRAGLEPSGPMSLYTDDETSPEEPIRAGWFAKLIVRSAADASPEEEGS
jgi:hypothetical protein